MTNGYLEFLVGIPLVAEVADRALEFVRRFLEMVKDPVSVHGAPLSQTTVVRCGH
jgi:hypothetical protein